MPGVREQIDLLQSGDSDTISEDQLGDKATRNIGTIFD
jgi:hypothetical protein